jgi:hypothetical protein
MEVGQEEGTSGAAEGPLVFDQLLDQSEYWLAEISEMCSWRARLRYVVQTQQCLRSLLHHVVHTAGMVPWRTVVMH